ncbi:hypothetical protein CV_1688 [Chromobacterium violaceum ATCC 12472]|uniref:Uncharacterized protein n=1 Tax=Chromobacterium violaceum (strain ATCC 12472 / DSM 30191 / JCM 1249 / CCUG 213 / NBRC 12614 / NCIMB 9131 / NCTC 9757 / MK) TaxID=243365 RepID=Q7NXD9_CHRVO|nr:hypothetical protein CV_1688 [Chromobacterium violaceum ATCC 12472]
MPDFPWLGAGCLFINQKPPTRRMSPVSANAPVSHIAGAKPCGSVVEKPRKPLNGKHEKRLPIF